MRLRGLGLFAILLSAAAAGCSSEDPADDGPAHVESNAAAGARRVSEKLVRRAATPPLTPSGLTVDDGVVSSTPRDSDLILLSNGVERVSLRAKAKRTAALDSRPGIRLLHTRGPIPDALPRELANRGILVLGYVPNNTLVYYDTGLDRSVSKLTARADYARAWGLSDRTSAKVALSEPEQDVAVVVVRHAYAAPVRERVEREALLQYSAPTVLDAAVVYRVRLTRGTLDELRYSPEVLWIEPYSRPIPLDEVQGMILAGELTGETPIGPGYRAWLKEHGIGPSMLETVKVDVTDSGCDTGTPLPLLHQELGGVETILNHTSEPEGNDVGGHGTLNLSIVGGNPTDGALDDSGYLYGLGIAPGVRLGSSRVFDGHDRWDAWTTQTAIVSAAQAAGAQITSNSWGSEVLGYYTTESQEYDAIVRDADRDASTGLDPMVVVFSAGNSGPDPRTIGAPGTAKNVITVGASENYRMTGTDGCGIRNSGADSARELAAFSSRGPTVDGRLKPELVAPGTHVQGALTTDFDPAVASICDGPWPLTTPPQSLYGWSSGTSHSAPAVAGVSAITYAWYRSKYAAPPSPALVKAMLVGHATSLGGGNDGGFGALSQIPSNDQGWGRADMSTLFEETDRVIYDQTQVLGTTGQRATTPMLYPTSPAEPVRIVLAWTDAPGSPFASAWVNDLNLRVVVDSSTEYLGNVFDSGQSSTGGTADPKNNLEAVYFPAEGVGGFVVHVDAAAINGDGIPGNVDLTDQDFALYIYNAAERPSCTSDADCDNGDPCTSGLCEADGRCTFAEACNDGDACTIDECEPDTGSCTHGALDCSDGNECTRDACDSVLGCVSTNADDCAACDGGQNVCVSGICGGMPYLTDDDFESGSLSKPWSTGGNAPWYLTNVTASGGGWSAASGNISDNQRSWLEVPVELGSAGTVSFNHRESTERHWDELCFAVDGVNLDCWSGSSNWLVAPSSFALAAGSHTLQWIYTKDFLLSDRRDTVYIDDVEVSGSVSCGGGACSSGHYGSAGCVTCQLPDGTSCESTSACMDGSTCIGGACGTPRDCSTYDAECSVGQCDPATGSCMAIAADDGTACNDSDPCTQGDVCVGGACRGTVVDCASLDDACNVAQCGAGSGTCEKNPMLDGTPCDDSNPCTDGDRCSSGVCAGSAADCSNTNEPCRIGQCDPLSGSCKAAPVSDGTACDDSDPCTDRDRCVAGDCRGTPVECSLGSDMCAVRRCSAETGGCELVPVPDGTSCDDGSECTVGDGCRGGVCAGATVECSGPNRECSASECDPATGKCNMAKSADGTSCNDSAPCTTDDVCSDGECVGTPIDCSGLTSPCVIGECDTSTGDCRTIPVENETPCSGGECQSGDCVARTGQGGGSSTASGGQDSSTDGGADASGGQDFASGGSSLGSGGDRTSGAGGSTGAGTGGGTGAGGTAGSGASTGTGGLGVTLGSGGGGPGITLGSGGGGPGITLGGGGGLDVTPGSGGGLGITLGRGGGPGIVFGGIGGSGTTSGSAGSLGSLLGSGGAGGVSIAPTADSSAGAAGGVSIAPTADSSAGAAGQEPAISALANARSLNPGGWDYRLTGRACTCRVVAPPRSGDVWSLGLIGAALYLRRMRRRRT